LKIFWKLTLWRFYEFGDFFPWRFLGTALKDHFQVYEDELGLINRDARKYYENGIPVLEQQQFCIVGKREIPSNIFL
jgi:hypothetical protein